MTILDPNSNIYSYIILNLSSQINDNLSFAYTNCDSLTKEEKQKLVQWFRLYGNKDYNYYVSEYGDNIIAKKIPLD